MKIACLISTFALSVLSLSDKDMSHHHHLKVPKVESSKNHLSDKVIDYMKMKKEEKNKGQKVLLEVIRINQRITVDEKNKPKTLSIDMQNNVYSIQSGHIRRLFGIHAHAVPKPGSNLFKALNNKSSEEGKPPGSDDKWKDWKIWLNDLALKWNLDKFWPRLIVSIVLGFITTTVIYLFAYMMFMLFCVITGYSPVNEEDDFPHSQSSENLLKYEQKRMEETKPLNPKV